MASIGSRLLRLEKAIASEDEEPPIAIPEEWNLHAEDGVIVGPPPGAHVTLRQRGTLSTIMAMDATISSG